MYANSRPHIVEAKSGSQHGWKACKKMSNAPSVSSRDIGAFSSVGFKCTALTVHHTMCFWRAVVCTTNCGTLMALINDGKRVCRAFGQQHMIITMTTTMTCWMALRWMKSVYLLLRIQFFIYEPSIQATVWSGLWGIGVWSQPIATDSSTEDSSRQ